MCINTNVVDVHYNISKTWAEMKYRDFSTNKLINFLKTIYKIIKICYTSQRCVFIHLTEF